ncbi:MAG: ABC transporter ATP-binding protein [Candidatus Fermentithermobacillus carboniphilus]|uniref:ABC transporter ATP-binding protein n=1 Tax=Candidatus Fermentithermobacillus carboniphilus TaxID=3085328 RepID=A0AAT9LCG8_9FIRM|nr:MAG: ABC transporter ATP-binding protein [Candidatus Fermentithermobacillus carboniphilus]
MSSSVSARGRDASQLQAGPRIGFGGHRGLGRPVEKPRDFKGTTKKLLRYLAPHKLSILAVLICAVLGTVFNIVSPRIMGRVTTKVFEGLMAKAMHVRGAAIDFGFIRQTLITLTSLYVLAALFNFAQHYIMAGVAQRVVYNMRKDVSVKLSRLPLKFFDSRTHGEILSRVTNDVDVVSSTLQQSLTQIISSAVTLVGVLTMMLSISPALTLVTLITIPLSAIVTVNVARRSQRFFAGQQKTLGELNGHVEEMYAGHKIVKAFSREKTAIERFKHINDELYTHAWKAQFVSGIMMPLISLVNNIGYIIIAVAGGIMVTKRAIAIGDVQAFISYSRQFTQPIVQTANIANIIQSTIAAAERVFEVLEEAEESPDPDDPVVLESPEGQVAFEHVRFGYREDAVLMEDINIAAKPGQVVAIVGPTGAGKTTLVNLLMRFYEVLDGRITLDSVDIRDMTRSHLRSNLGMVLQDTWLFSGSIRDNIAYGREGASMEEIVKAAQAARADHFIRTLPEGYDTIINEDSTNISQGQMQLITIARAILANPVVLILDEATSSVDTRTELHIQEAMRDLMKGRTSFIIAHRLSTIRNADLILVMNEGKIIEQGTHAELMARKGFYYELYTSQFTGANRVA